MHEQLAAEVQYRIVAYAGRSGHNRLSKDRVDFGGLGCPKIFHEIEDTLAFEYMNQATTIIDQLHREALLSTLSK
ncbi:MAG: hypothetical protein KZQ66_06730 [Candidatus Thiodiazotropha sp. (ex Lucinoma aequizonata)]|nr:hypothetical protein [Candidatus Thiodiazotropha sp. (ex Lucinoma aequizonata)]